MGSLLSCFKKLKNDVENERPTLRPEIWDKIFLDLHSEDFLSVINACPQWNQLLASRKTCELFQMVLPYLAPFLEPEELLAFRGVTKSSKAYVEKVLKTLWTSPELAFDLPHNESSSVSRLYSTVGRISNTFSFGIMEEPNRFMREASLQAEEDLLGYLVYYGTSTYTPFLTRSLQIDWQEPRFYAEPESRRFFDNNHLLQLIFSRYGKGIRRLKVTFLNSEVLGRWIIQWLYEWLPNLKILEVCWTLEPSEPRDRERIGRMDYVVRHDQLEHMELTQVKDHKVTSLLIISCQRRLKTVAVQGKWLEFTEIRKLPKLKNLRVVGASLNALEELPTFKFPLKTLHIQLAGPVNIVTDYLEELILLTVSTFKRKLTQLELRLENVKFVDDETLDLIESQVEDWENLETTCLNNEDCTTLSSALFKSLHKLQKLVVWYKTQDGQVVKRIMKSSKLSSSCCGCI